MSESPKFSVKFSTSICEVLEEGYCKLELVKAFPLESGDFMLDEKPVCRTIIDTKTFLKCSEVQGRLNKIKCDESCEEMVQLLHDVHDEFKSCQTINKLIHHVDEGSQMLLEMSFAIENYRKQKLAVKKLERLLTAEEEFEKRKEIDVDNKLWQSNCKRHKQEIDVAFEKNYCETWVNSQLRQNEIELTNAEHEVTDKLLTVAKETFDTEDVYFKISKFYNVKTKELQDEAKRLSAEYDFQIDNVETQFQIASSAKKELMQIIQAEQGKFDKREREMKAYLEAKRMKESEAKLLALQSVKVVVIQAWWRGNMVRKHLGRFKTFKKRARKIKNEFRDAKNEKQRKMKKGNNK